MRKVSPSGRRGFTLVELLVVIGIIALLIAILLPALSRARAQANAVKCASQMRDIGQQLYMYAMSNKGVILPLKATNGPPGYKHRGGDELPQERWPMYAFIPPPTDKQNYIAPIMICPTDPYPPGGDHSYDLNGVFFPLQGSTDFNNQAIRLGNRVRYFTPSEVVLMVDKWPGETEWHLDVQYTNVNSNPPAFDAPFCKDQWYRLVFNDLTQGANNGKNRRYKHGKSGNNYLHFDMSVGNAEPPDPNLPGTSFPGMVTPHTYIKE
jgi:prepilin-type N-terminal cleavage/methylation domain-containing protein